MSQTGFFPQDIIIRKRDGGALTKDEIEFFAHGVADGRFADYQATALLMAIFWRGMTPQETAWLTDAMMRTGGVGDKVSLILAPLAAACGVKVPMMSGRGLGHTGGTLDKLESIPGFRVMLSVPEFRAILQQVGAAMIGQTPQVVPADRKLYALRDVTGTVECLPLICASIMSKKLAEGIDSLVLDVKFGRGAFMKKKADALALARAMVDVGRAGGKPVRALLTAMNQPLGRCAGHTTEVIESIECLKGRGPADLMEVTYALTGHMLILGGVAKDESDARAKMEAAIADGRALEKFRAMCIAQGGDPRVVDDYSLLPTAKKKVELRAGADARGFVGAVDALKCGHAIMALGGGRAAVTDKVDHAVGLSNLIKIGDPVEPGTLLGTIHSNDDAKAAAAEKLLRDAITFASEPIAQEPLVQDLVQ
jgi:pyrimidine-nucleoside phosphorylase